MAAQANTASPEAKEPANKQDVKKTKTLSGIPPQTIPAANIVSNLTGIPNPPIPDTLPDLVTTRVGDTENTEDELDAVDALLSLGDTQDPMIEEDDNAALMPIGGPTNIVDVAPIQILLDQINVDNSIANIIETEKLEKEAEKSTAPDLDQTDANKPAVPEETDTTSANAPDPNTNPRPKSASPNQGSLKIKTHALKKKSVSKQKYKCSVCGETRPYHATSECSPLGKT